MRLIDADKLHPDRMTNKGTVAISQSQIANAKTVEAVPLSVIEKIHDAIDNAESDGFLINENGHMLAMTLTKEHVDEIIYKAVKECTHE